MTRQTPVVSLPMYDLPELRGATDTLWQALRSRLIESGFDALPEHLDRGGDVHRQWSSKDLLFSQTCGYPLTHEFDGKLQLVATPAYDVTGCRNADYRSFVVVAKDSGFNKLDDLAGLRAVYNTDDSMSGMLALKSVFAPLARAGRVFSEVNCSGGHLRSMQMVVDGAAHVAAIDCVTFALVERHRPHISNGLRIIAEGPSVPSLPYVTAKARSSQQVEAIKSALVSVMTDPTLNETRDRLRLAGIASLQRSDYERILDIEREADRLGYPDLV